MQNTLNMPALVLLSEERARRAQEDQMRLIVGLQELLAMAERGEIKAVCYAALDSNGQNFAVDVLRDENTGLLEMIGLAQILNDSLLARLRD